MGRSLYKSADMKNEMIITLDPMDGFKHMRGQFGVDFQDESNGEVTVKIS